MSKPCEPRFQKAISVAAIQNVPALTFVRALEPCDCFFELGQIAGMKQAAARIPRAKLKVEAWAVRK